MTIDRTIAPPFGKLGHFPLAPTSTSYLSNGIPVHVIESGRQEVMMVQLVFPCGKAAGHRNLVAAATAALMEEGTENRTGAEIAAIIDHYGAQLGGETDTDETALTLYTLTKHLAPTLDILADVALRPSFPQDELVIYKRNQQQSAMVNEQKVGHLARRAFLGAIFGKENPMGRGAYPDDFSTLNGSDIALHHTSRIKGNVAHIIVAGRPDEWTIDLLEKHFGTMERRHDVFRADITGLPSPTRISVEKEGAVQDAIRVGRVLFNREHPDFVGMQFLATVLGGYFGSRLMANIREDKGYTYGIGANLIGFRETGYLTINTEVGSDVRDAALTEIFKEMAVLRENAIPQQELDTVSSYLLGMILKSMDGPFALASKWRGYLKHGLDTSAHDDTLAQITAMTPQRLLDLAKLYLREEDMTVVTAGRK
jgi:zinc protease